MYFAVQDGGIVRNVIKDNPLSGVGEVLANRTYDESGNYTVQGMTVDVREHLQNAANTNGGVYTAAKGGDRDGLVIGIAPGKSYVGGFKRTLQSFKRPEYACNSFANLPSPPDTKTVFMEFAQTIYLNRSIVFSMARSTLSIGVNPASLIF